MRFRYQNSNFCTVLQIISTMVLIFFSKSCTSYSFVPIHHCFSADVCTCKLLQIHNCLVPPVYSLEKTFIQPVTKIRPRKNSSIRVKIHIETKFTTTGGSSAERPFGISGLLTRQDQHVMPGTARGCKNRKTSLCGPCLFEMVRTQSGYKGCGSNYALDHSFEEVK